ncbi:platelet factor 4 [Sorex araneus]|uniref:platelet factor 4 n=1 Tax=Sorex araneus TaxID=42254 RepID=UPI00064B578D|nr:platelet factor 4 [Sorex araneus]
MSLRASCLQPGPAALLLGLLLLPALVVLTKASPVILEDLEGEGRDLQCLCVKTTSQFHLKHISSLEVIVASAHCPALQVIATLKDGKKICLDPQVSKNKNILRKILKSQLQAAVHPMIIQ